MNGHIGKNGKRTVLGVTLLYVAPLLWGTASAQPQGAHMNWITLNSSLGRLASAQAPDGGLWDFVEGLLPDGVKQYLTSSRPPSAAPPIPSAESRRYQIPATGFQAVRIAQEEGATTVTGVETNAITVTYIRREGGPRCDPQFITAGDTFRIITHAKGDECAVDLQITMPRRFALRAGIAAGTLSLHQLEGRLRLEVGAGAVSGVIGSAQTEVELATGRVDLEWDRLPNPGSVMFEAAAGAVNLTLPRGSVADVVLRRTPVVNASIKVTQQPGATFKIGGRMGFGTFSVREKAR